MFSGNIFFIVSVICDLRWKSETLEDNPGNADEPAEVEPKLKKERKKTTKKGSKSKWSS